MKLRKSCIFLFLFAGPLLWAAATLADYVIGDGNGQVSLPHFSKIILISTVLGILAALFLIFEGRFRKLYVQGLLCFFLAVLVAEVGLRFSFVLRNSLGNKDNFLRNDTIQVRNDPKIHDAFVINTFNELGFKGPSLYNAQVGEKRIFFVGNSVAACGYLTNGEDWPLLVQKHADQDQVPVWVNNAAMLGQSSLGNLWLLKKYILNLKPDYVVLMTGFTEEPDGSANYFDRKVFSELRVTEPWEARLHKYSYFWRLYSFLKSRQIAERNMSNTFAFDFAKEKYRNNTDSSIAAYRQKLAKRNTVKFYNNVKEIAARCKTQKVKLLLITHPTLLGGGRDPLTGADLDRVVIYDKSTGVEVAMKNKLYNDVLRKVAEEEGIPLLDFEKEFPKSSAYFFDHEHFTKQGSKLAAEMVWGVLKKDLTNGTE